MKRGFTKGDPRAIAAGKKGYQVLRSRGIDPIAAKSIEDHGYRKGFADGLAKGREERDSEQRSTALEMRGMQ